MAARRADTAFAQARLQARHGAMPDEHAWHAVESSRTTAHYLALARNGPLARWVEGIGDDADLHRIERGLRGRWRRYVDEVARWQAPAWRDATRWFGVLVDLQLVAGLLRGDERARAAWPELAANADVRARAEVLRSSGYAPLAALPQDGGARALTATWLAEWRRRLPPGARRDRALSAPAGVARPAIARRGRRARCRGRAGAPRARQAVSPPCVFAGGDVRASRARRAGRRAPARRRGRAKPGRPARRRGTRLMLRPLPCRWFELITTRRDVAHLAALADRGAIELEAHAPEPWPALTSGAERVLARFRAIERTWRGHWPAPRIGSQPIVDPAATLDARMAALESWSADAAPLVAERSGSRPSRGRSRTSAACSRRCPGASPSRVNRRRARFAVEMHVHAIAEQGPPLDLPAGVLRLAIRGRSEDHVVTVGRARDLATADEHFAGRKARRIVVPGELAGSASDAIASRSVAVRSTGAPRRSPSSSTRWPSATTSPARSAISV